MSLLDEEKPSRGLGSMAVAALAAVVIASAGVAAYVHFGQKPQAVVGSVDHVWVHPVHREDRPVQGPGMGGDATSFDEVLVLSQVTLKNQSEKPVELLDLLTDVTLADGAHESYAAYQPDYDNIFKVYPELNTLHGTPLARETVLQPGSSVTGMVVSAFQVAPADWAKQSGLGLTLRFAYQKDLHLTPAAAVVSNQ